jgi:GntR family transcriptional regulator, vanillate catabolism transcriptional regulator
MAGITLREQALERLRRLIVSGNWSHEAPKCSERELAEMLGMSRTPVREALAVLVQHGLVNNYPQVGVEVRVPTLYEADQALLLRRGIESIVVCALAERAESQPEIIKAVKHLADNVEQQMLNGDIRLPEVRLAFREADSAFHSGMAELAGFTASVPLIRSLRDRIHLFRLIHSSPEPYGEYWDAAPKVRKELMDTVREHSQIVNALAAKTQGTTPRKRAVIRAREARRALVQHLKATRDRLRADLVQSEFAGGTPALQEA